ncbi:hypothetical protein MAR_018808 [Mya arenaria]|uniref:Uncharacterized protein n=1 Tax=Mya arenaria TaxID=6604 RepID=A0ABY7EG45_MYAAR|nr:uncharacterized protein LOC128237022 [Mya arenaria]WAR08850.1 hypothetical protein MAR_018808 [Mya arenaria]
MSSTTSLIRYDDEIKRRLEKLSRTYDLTTMKIFIAVECLGEELVTCTYNATKKGRWEAFLQRREACRLDLHKHEKNKTKYQEFLKNVSREHQGQQFYNALLMMMKLKGADDAFKQLGPNVAETNDSSFCSNLCRLFERKIESWFETFEAVAVKLTGHVKVSNFVRVLAGQVDALCCKGGFTYAINIKVTGLETPRPLDIAELQMCKILVIQNGLAVPSNLKMCLLVLHLTEERPILRLWEYTPTSEMDTSIKEADIDKLIDAGKLSQYHEFWKDNVHQISAVQSDQVL